MVARQKTTLRKAIESAVVLIFLVSMYLLILVPFVLYAVMRGLTDADYLCELAKATGGRVLLLNRGAERQRLYFQIGEDIEMVIMQVRASVARQEELLFELKID